MFSWLGDEATRRLYIETWIERLLLIAVVVILVLLLLHVVKRVLNGLQVTQSLPEAALLPVRRLLRLLVIGTAVLLTLQLFGVPMSAIWAGISAVVALIAIGFVAVWSVLSNIACSILLLLVKPFRIGDYVELVETAAGPNVNGRVTDLTLMYVVLREELDDGSAQMVQIPNNLFFQKMIRRRSGRRAINLEDHVDKHGLQGRDQTPPTKPDV